MKLPQDSIISERTLKDYLLSPSADDDKSDFLALAGYAFADWSQLETDLRNLIAAEEAELTRTTEYGDMYQVRGTLAGPNGNTLSVITIWIRLHANGETRFVTLIPNKEERN